MSPTADLASKESRFLVPAFAGSEVQPLKSSFPPPKVIIFALETIIFTPRNDCLGIKNAVENLKTPLGAIASCASLTPFRTGTHGAKGRFGWFYKLFKFRKFINSPFLAYYLVEP